MAIVTLEELFKSSPRREIKPSNNNKKRLVKNKSLIETLVKNGDITSRMAENGTTKMKILVKKQDLKQMLETMNIVSNNNDSTTASTATTPPPSRASLSSIERRLHDLMRRKRSSSNQACRQGRHSISSWRPALHSIPEEYC